MRRYTLILQMHPDVCSEEHRVEDVVSWNSHLNGVSFELADGTIIYWSSASIWNFRLQPNSRKPDKAVKN